MGNAYRSVLALKPTGDAVPANVLAGKTFSNAAGTGKTGTMVNNGAVSVTLTDQDPTYTIPEGYHNGLGVVGFTTSGGDGADLVVTCDSLFAGTTITCTDGTTTFEEICPSTSPYVVTFQSIPIGTWTISGTYSGHTYSTIFTVLNFETSLHSIPEGSTATPTDDIQTWLQCANIWDKNYTTISQVLADASTLQALMASNNAADYMARSTTWASDVTADSSAMTYIGLDDYCSNKLLSSEWLDYIVASSYIDSVLNVKIPTMTSNTTPSGTAYASSVYNSGGETHPAYLAMDGNNTTFWASAGGGFVPCYIQYTFTNAVKVNAVEFVTGGISGALIRSVELIGSNDGFTTSEQIKAWTENIGTTEDKKVPITNTNRYTAYRLKINTIADASVNTNLRTLQFYGRL